MSGRGSVARALTPASGPVWVAAIGKAASAMALGAHDVLGVSIERTLIITKDDHVAPQLHALRNVEIHESAHPVPDQRSLAAGASLLKWVQELPRSVEPLFLISGGASSLVEVLEEGVTFEQLGQVRMRKVWRAASPSASSMRAGPSCRGSRAVASRVC